MILSRPNHEAKIKHYLKEIFRSQKSGSILVYGEGGVGKSTLISTIYQDIQFIRSECHVLKQYWLSPAEFCDISKLVKTIEGELFAIDIDLSKPPACLLILDDVTNPQTPGDVISSLNLVRGHFAIIFISRIRTVEMMEWARFVEPLEPWGDDELAKLFEEEGVFAAFVKHNRQNALLSACQGLPMVARRLVDLFKTLTNGDSMAQLGDLLGAVNSLSIGEILRVTLDYTSSQNVRRLYALLVFDDGDPIEVTEAMLLWELHNDNFSTSSVIIDLIDKSLLRHYPNNNCLTFTVHSLMRQAIFDHFLLTTKHDEANWRSPICLGLCEEEFIVNLRHLLSDEPNNKTTNVHLLREFRRALICGHYARFDFVKRCLNFNCYRFLIIVMKNATNESLVRILEESDDPELFMKQIVTIFQDDEDHELLTIFCMFCEALAYCGKIGSLVQLPKVIPVDATFGPESETLPMVALDEKCRRFLDYLGKTAPSLLEVKDASGNSVLSRALSNGDLQATKAMLHSCKMSLQERNSDGLTPLGQAIKSNDAALVELVLACGDEHLADGEMDIDETYLYTAASESAVEVVALLLRYGANAYKVDGAGWAPIHIAALMGKTRNITELLEHVDKPHEMVDLATNNGQRPLMLAAQGCNLEAINLLLAKNANVNAKDINGYTALLHAAFRSNNMKVGKLLYDKSNDRAILYNQKLIDSYAHYYPDSYENVQKFRQAISDNCTELTMPEKCCDVEIPEDIWQNIWDAVSQGDCAVFLKHSREVDVQNLVRKTNYLGRTLLHQAAAKGHVDITLMLLQYGADLYAESFSEDFCSKPIHVAARHNRSGVFKLFLRKDANLLHAKNLNGNTPMHVAAINGSEAVLGLCVEAGADIEEPGGLKRTALLFAAANGHVSTVEKLLRLKADYLKSDFNKSTPIHVAVYMGHLKVVIALLKQHPELLELENERHETPLFRAAFRGRLEIARYLIEHGAQLSEGMLFNTIEWNRPQIFELFIKQNPNLLLATNANGLSAHDLAISKGRLAIVEIISHIENEHV